MRFLSDRFLKHGKFISIFFLVTLWFVLPSPAYAQKASSLNFAGNKRIKSAYSSMLIEGDSIAAGYSSEYIETSWPMLLGTYLQTYFHLGGQIFNKAVGGSTSADVLSRIGVECAQSNPDLVVIAVGLNDLRSGVALNTYLTNLGSILAACPPDQNRTVLVADLTYMTNYTDYPGFTSGSETLRQQWSNAIDNYIATTDAFLIPVNSFMNSDTYLVSLDGVHPTNPGQQLIGAKTERTFSLWKRNQSLTQYSLNDNVWQFFYYDLLTQNVKDPIIDKSPAIVGTFSLIKTDNTGIITIAAFPGKYADTHIFFPLVYNNYYGYMSGIALTNTEDRDGTVTFAFYNSDGTVAGTFPNISLPGNSTKNFYVPNSFSTMLTGQFSLEIFGTTKMVASTNGVATGSRKYLGYRGFSPAYLSSSVFIMKAWKNYTNQGWNTGIGLQNPSAVTVGYTIKFIDNSTGAIVASLTDTVNPHGFKNYFVPNIAALSSLSEVDGSAVVIADDPQAQLVGIFSLANSNNAYDDCTYEASGNREAGYSLYYPEVYDEPDTLFLGATGLYTGFTSQNSSGSASMHLVDEIVSGASGLVQRYDRTQTANIPPYGAAYAVLSNTSIFPNLPAGTYAIRATTSQTAVGLFNPAVGLYDPNDTTKNEGCVQAMTDFHADGSLYIPQIPKSSGGWMSKISIQNTRNQPVTATFSYKNLLGVTVQTETHILSPYASVIVTPQLVEDGYAVVTAD